MSNNQVIHIISVGTLVRCLSKNRKVESSNEVSFNMFSTIWDFKSIKSLIKCKNVELYVIDMELSTKVNVVTINYLVLPW